MISTELNRAEQYSLLAIFGAGAAIISNSFNGDGNPIFAALAYSGIAFSVTYALIRWLGGVFMNAGFKGKDMSKSRKVEMYAPNLCTVFGISEVVADVGFIDQRLWAQSALWCIS